MRHAPCAFVGNTELALQFLCRYAMPGRGKQEHGVEPLVDRSPGALHRRSHARIDVVLAMLAKKRPVAFQAIKPGMFATVGAVNISAAVADIHDMNKAGFIIGELFFKLVKCCHFNVLTNCYDQVQQG